MQSTDLRDSQTWVVLELTRAGEQKCEDGSLEQLLRNALQVRPDYPVFIPALFHSGGPKKTSIHLMVGYAFVQSGLTDSLYYSLETSTPYVKKVLSTRSPSGLRVLSVIPNKSVLEMREQLAQSVASDIQAGLSVTIEDGDFAKLDGRVLQVVGNIAHVHISLRSIEIKAPIPCSFLRPSDEEVVL